MKTKEIIKSAGELAKPFRINKGKDFRLKDVDPDDTLDFTKEADKPRAKETLAMGVTALAELQDKLYAQDKWAVLLIFQAMDAAGKDGAIKHVLSGVNPQGCQVYSFKSPSSEDLDHDYLWRCMVVTTFQRCGGRSQESLGRRYSRVPASLLELNHVVKNRPEIGKVVDIPSKLLDDRIAQTQRQALQNAFFGAPLEIKIELVLPKLPR